MIIPSRLRFMLFTTIGWAAAWATIGLLAGIAMTFARRPPIAEPGAPSAYAFYAFWIPVCLGAGSVFGLLAGLIYSGLLAAIGFAMPGNETESNRSMATYGWRMVCGAAA